MRTCALLICAFALSGSATLAAEVRGCVEVRDLANGGKCRILKARSGEFFALQGANLPPIGSGTVVAVSGRITRDGCPLRIIRRQITVEKWGFTRSLCPR